jgi:hypothetical protein
MDRPSPFTVHGTLDGATLRFGGQVVDEFPNIDAAWAASKVAEAAIRELERVLRREAA